MQIHKYQPLSWHKMKLVKQGKSVEPNEEQLNKIFEHIKEMERVKAIGGDADFDSEGGFKKILGNDEVNLFHDQVPQTVVQTAKKKLRERIKQMKMGSRLSPRLSSQTWKSPGGGAGTEMMPVKNSHTRIKPLVLTSGHGRYITHHGRYT